MKSNIMKSISYTVLVLGIIGSFIGGAAFKTYDFKKLEFVYNAELVIIGIISVLVLFFILFTLATLLEKFETYEKLQIKLLIHSEKTLNMIESVTAKAKQSSQSIESKNINELLSDSKKVNTSIVNNLYKDNYEKQTEIKNCIKCGSELNGKKNCDECGTYQLLHD